jgi:hypothetical protein
MGEIVPLNNPVSSFVGDPWQAVLEPCRAVDAAIETIEPAIRWLQQSADRMSGFDADGPEDVVKALPTTERLTAIAALLRQAETEPAAESWTNAALGLVLASEPASGVNGEAWRGAIIDGLFHDRSVREGYRPGVSVPVLIEAIREARLQGALPSPGVFIKMCQRHRRQFQKWQEEIGVLMDARAAADIEVRAIAHHAAEPARGNRWRRPYIDDPDDLPF